MSEFKEKTRKIKKSTFIDFFVDFFFVLWYIYIIRQIKEQSMNIRKSIEQKAKREFRSNRIQVIHENNAWYVLSYLGHAKYIVFVNENYEISFRLI